MDAACYHLLRHHLLRQHIDRKKLPVLYNLINGYESTTLTMSLLTLELVIGFVEPGMGRRLLRRVDRRTAQRRRMIRSSAILAIFSHGTFDQPSDTPTPASLAGM